MSFSFVALSIEGVPVVVNSDELPTSSKSINGSLGFFPSFSIPSNPFQFTPNSQYYPFTTIMQDDFSRRGSYYGDGIQAVPIRKKRKANVFEEDEATCAKCHYRRKCMKCINCMARFCEQRCLTRYLDDPTEQEEARVTNNWLCPCCRGLEPVADQDILRSDEKEEQPEESADQEHPPATPQPTEVTPRPRIVPANTAPPAPPQPVQPTVTPIAPPQGDVDPKEHREEDEACAVCGDIFSYDHNDIIFCEGCNVAAHQVCYGVYKVPSGDWHCDRCRARTFPLGIWTLCSGSSELGGVCGRFTPGIKKQCNLCGLKGGAMKQLLDKPHNWVHVTCVATLYECAPLDLEEKIGPLGVIEKIDKRRYKLVLFVTQPYCKRTGKPLPRTPPVVADYVFENRCKTCTRGRHTTVICGKCEICKEKGKKDITGPLIQCVAKKCTKAFHPICAQHRLVYNKQMGILVTHCNLHAPPKAGEGAAAGGGGGGKKK